MAKAHNRQQGGKSTSKKDQPEQPVEAPEAPEAPEQPPVEAPPEPDPNGKQQGFTVACPTLANPYGQQTRVNGADGASYLFDAEGVCEGVPEADAKRFATLDGYQVTPTPK